MKRRIGATICLVNCTLAFVLIAIRADGEAGIDTTDTSALQHCPESAAVDHLWGTWSDIAEVIFAGALVVVAIFQACLLRRANRTASAALKEARKGSKATRDSVEAYIALERGRLVCVSAKYNQEWNWIDYEFRNVGRSGLMITRFESSFYTVEGDSKNPLAMVSATPQYTESPLAPFYMIDRGEVFTSVNGSFRLPKGERASMDMVVVGGTLVAHWRIRYTTDQGRVYQRTHCIVFYNHGYSSMIDSRYMSDTRMEA